MLFKEWCTKSCVVGTLGLILAGFGTLFIIFWAEIFEHQLSSQLILSPESRTYEMWNNPPIPISLDIYLFNWTNPHDFLNHSTKPILKECGPYVFREKPFKVNMTWHPENQTVSYMKKSRFYFDAAKSKGSLDDVITSLNVVPLAAAETARHKDFMEKTKVSVGLQIYDQEISVTKLAREFLFEGYEDDLVNAAKELPFLTEGQAVPFDRVGWFYMRNDTADLTGVFNMHTGEGDPMKLGKLMKWNYNSRTDYFADTCGMINGSAGELYPQKLTKDEPISLFTPDLCRSLPLYYEKEEVVNGLNGYMYSGGERTVDNGTKYPDNWCFCGGECVPSGVLNISACRYGTPVFMSFPHYYGADPFYLNQVEGMSPSEDKHKFFMTMEPTLGIPIDVAARLQLNLLVRPSPGVGLYKEVPEVYFPILWFEQRVTILPEIAKEMQQVFLVPTIGYWVLGVTIVIGLIMIFWFPLATLICGRRFEKDDKTAGQTKKVAPLNDGPDSPLMLKRKDVEMQPVVAKQYMFEKPKADTNNDERYA